MIVITDSGSVIANDLQLSLILVKYDRWWSNETDSLSNITGGGSNSTDGGSNIANGGSNITDNVWIVTDWNRMRETSLNTCRSAVTDSGQLSRIVTGNLLKYH